MKYKYYFVFRRNKEKWDINYEHPFVININDGNIVGQFLSFNWFQHKLVFGDSYDCLVIKINSDSVFLDTKKFILSSLEHAERKNIGYQQLQFVVLHKHYSGQDIGQICQKVSDEMIQVDGDIGKNRFGLTFYHTYKDKVKSKTSKTHCLLRQNADTDDYQYYVTCPTFITRYNI